MIHLGGPRRGPGGPMAARLNAEKPKHTKKTILRLLRYIGKSGILILILLGIMLAVTAAELLGPFFQAKAIDTIHADEISGRLSVDLASMKAYLLLMAVMFVISAILS